MRRFPGPKHKRKKYEIHSSASCFCPVFTFRWLSIIKTPRISDSQVINLSLMKIINFRRGGRVITERTVMPMTMASLYVAFPRLPVPVPFPVPYISSHPTVFPCLLQYFLHFACTSAISVSLSVPLALYFIIGVHALLFVFIWRRV